jgi:hypothetical protein
LTSPITSLTISSCNVTTLSQIPSPAVVPNLRTLTITPEGNPVTALHMLRPYLVYRHSTLKSVNIADRPTGYVGGIDLHRFAFHIFVCFIFYILL